MIKICCNKCKTELANGYIYPEGLCEKCFDQRVIVEDIILDDEIEEAREVKEKRPLKRGPDGLFISNK